MSETALTPINDNPNPLALDASILDNLDSYDDFLSLYIQLDQTSSAFSWLKADLLLRMTQKLGDNSVQKLAEDIKQPASTIVNYTRTALAFPPEKREEGASFSLHFQASFADSLPDKSKGFETDKRFEWLERAMDENMSTRKLAEQIQIEKTGGELPKSNEDRQMQMEAQSAAIEVKKYVENLLKEVKRHQSKEAYFEIIKVHQFINGQED